MRTVEDWLQDYAVSHRHPVNKALHWVCVPLIVLSVLGLLWSVPMPATLAARAPLLNCATLEVGAGLVYYAVLSPRLALAMVPVLALMLASLVWLAQSAPPLWRTCVAIFAVAWIGQFVGHAIEGRRPSFFEDMQFLLIGPLWLLGAAFRRAGLRY